jgi:hypothetical protein
VASFNRCSYTAWANRIPINICPFLSADKKVFAIGTQEWADVDWDTPVHPCTTPIETRHLFGISS